MTAVAGDVAALFEHRLVAGRALGDDAELVARACHDMARRFARGGKLIVFGSGAAATDAQHLAVEFVHPVIVGKRAFPALSLTGDVATLTGVASRDGVSEVFARQLRLLADPDDIALGLSADGRCALVRRGLEAARERGLLTVALAGGDGGRDRPPAARRPRLRRPLQRPAGRQGGARDDLPRALGAGARLLRAPGGPRAGGRVVSGGVESLYPFLYRDGAAAAT